MGLDGYGDRPNHLPVKRPNLPLYSLSHHKVGYDSGCIRCGSPLVLMVSEGPSLGLVVRRRRERDGWVKWELSGIGIECLTVPSQPITG